MNEIHKPKMTCQEFKQEAKALRPAWLRTEIETLKQHRKEERKEEKKVKRAKAKEKKKAEEKMREKGKDNDKDKEDEEEGGACDMRGRVVSDGTDSDEDGDDDDDGEADDGEYFLSRHICDKGTLERNFWKSVVHGIGVL